MALVGTHHVPLRLRNIQIVLIIGTGKLSHGRTKEGVKNLLVLTPIHKNSFNTHSLSTCLLPALGQAVLMQRWAKLGLDPVLSDSLEPLAAMWLHLQAAIYYTQHISSVLFCTSHIKSLNTTILSVHSNLQMSKGTEGLWSLPKVNRSDFVKSSWLWKMLELSAS